MPGLGVGQDCVEGDYANGTSQDRKRCFRNGVGGRMALHDRLFETSFLAGRAGAPDLALRHRRGPERAASLAHLPEGRRHRKSLRHEPSAVPVYRYRALDPIWGNQTAGVGGVIQHRAKQQGDGVALKRLIGKSQPADERLRSE